MSDAARRNDDEEYTAWREEQNLDELVWFDEVAPWPVPLRHNPEHGNPEEPGPTADDLHEDWP